MHSPHTTHDNAHSSDLNIRTSPVFRISTIAALFRLNSLGLTGRYAMLKREIGEGMHDEVWARLAPDAVDDVIAAITPGQLPRLSPSLRNRPLPQSPAVS